MLQRMKDPQAAVLRIVFITLSAVGADITEAEHVKPIKNTMQHHTHGLVQLGAFALEKGGTNGRLHIQCMCKADIIPDATSVQDMTSKLLKEHSPGLSPPPPRGYHVVVKLHMEGKDNITWESMLGCVPTPVPAHRCIYTTQTTVPTFLLRTSCNCHGTGI